MRIHKYDELILQINLQLKFITKLHIIENKKQKLLPLVDANSKRERELLAKPKKECVSYVNVNLNGEVMRTTPQLSSLN